MAIDTTRSGWDTAWDNPYKRGFERKKEASSGKYNYGTFNPFVAEGDYVVITDIPNEIILEECRRLVREQIKCKIPYDFSEFVQINVEKMLPRPEDPREMWAMKWRYTPPQPEVVRKILEDAQHRAFATKIQKYSRVAQEQLEKYHKFWADMRMELPKNTGKTIKFRRYGEYKAE